MGALCRTLRAALCVVGTGIQWGGQTTLAARTAIEKADSVLFAVANAWTARWIRELNPRATSLPYPRDGRPRRAIYDEMVDRILLELGRHERVCAVFYGSPAVFTAPAHAAVRRARREGHDARMVPGVSFLDCMFADLGIDPGEHGCQIFEARALLRRNYAIEPRSHLIVPQVALAASRTPFVAGAPDVSAGLSQLAERLCATYPTDHEVVLYEAAAHPLERPRADRFALARLETASLGEISTLWVPPIPAGSSRATPPDELAGITADDTARIE